MLLRMLSKPEHVPVIFLLLLLWPFLPARAERLPLKPYTTAEGLAHNTVNRIVRDSRGFLWFCTDEGLSRFDGYSFTKTVPRRSAVSKAVAQCSEPD